MKKIFSFVAILAVSALLPLSFQNCGNIKLDPKVTPPPPAPQAKALPQGKACSGTGALFGTPVRFTFVIDMSLSNLGGSIISDAAAGGKYYWSLDLPNATDKDKKRLDAVNSFISTCGNSAEFKYSILGFSDNAMFSSNLKTCSSPFESSTAALESVKGFKAIQDADLTRNGAVEYVTPFKMGNTAYNMGLNCLNVNINADANTAGMADVPIYQTFFLTDGQPTDYGGVATEQINSYKATMKNLIDSVLPFSSGIKLNTIYYGPESQKAAATTMLDAIAQTTDPLAKTDYVDNFATLATKMCDLYKPQATYAYRSYQTTAVNINRVQYENDFEPDSDADGLSDKEEIKLGFDPLNARSKGVLDSLCTRAGFSFTNCAAPAACIQDYRGFALTDCDIKFASAYFGKTLNGYDTDLDQIVDFIEIIRGTNPVAADMQFDTDKDGVTNIREIINGSSVTNKVAPEDDDLIRFNWGKSTQASTCASTSEEPYAFSFQQAPVTTGLSYTDPLPGKVNFSHSGTENIYLVVYLTEPRGSSTLPKRLNAVKILTSTEVDPVVEQSVYIGDFTK